MVQTDMAGNGQVDAVRDQYNTMIRNGAVPTCDDMLDIAANATLGADGAGSGGGFQGDHAHPTQASAQTIMAPTISAHVNYLTSNLTTNGAGNPHVFKVGAAMVPSASAAGANWQCYPTTIRAVSPCISSAAPAVCGNAATGSVVIAAAGTTVTVNTTAVTASNKIILSTDDTLGTPLGVTCNSTLATLVGGVTVTARTAGTSFQITSGTTPAVNPLCINYSILP